MINNYCYDMVMGGVVVIGGGTGRPADNQGGMA